MDLHDYFALSLGSDEVNNKVYCGVTSTILLVTLECYLQNLTLR